MPLGAIRAIVESGVELEVDSHPLFTISEEIGSGASGLSHGDVSEVLKLGNGTSAPGQNSREFGVTICMADMVGPFGNDLRIALATFGIDASYGWERIHWHALESLAELVTIYMQAPPLYDRDREGIGPRHEFPASPIE